MSLLIYGRDMMTRVSASIGRCPSPNYRRGT